MVMVMVVVVMMAFMPVLDAAVRLGFNRIRLGISFDNICGTQRFAFQAHRAEQTSHLRTAEEPIRTSRPASGEQTPRSQAIPGRNPPLSAIGCCLEPKQRRAAKGIPLLMVRGNAARGQTGRAD